MSTTRRGFIGQFVAGLLATTVPVGLLSGTVATLVVAPPARGAVMVQIRGRSAGWVR